MTRPQPSTSSPSVSDPSLAPHQGHDLSRVTCGELFTKFGLEKGTIDFIGHALALYDSDR